MDINKHIVDQRIHNIVAENPFWFVEIDKNNKQHEEAKRKKLAKAFVCLAVATYLNIELAEAEQFLTEGGNDAGVDAIVIGDIRNYEFPVTIFQGKYGFDLEKDSNFPANSVQKVIAAIGAIFDPKKPVLANKALKPQIEEIHSLILDGYVPIIEVVFANNGLKWTEEGENHIKNANYPPDQVLFTHFNHTEMVNSLKSPKQIHTTLKLIGKSFQEDFNFKRVLIGKLNVKEIADLLTTHGDTILEKNIRKYLGIHKNRVNQAIKDTLLGNKKDNFYFYNNGITMICSKFSYNALQQTDWTIKVDDLQIINGGQSCKTIQHTLNENPAVDFSQVFILVRLYELDGEGIDELINDVTIATNSQNPVDLKDLRANDSIQISLEKDIKELGFTYKRKKEGYISNDLISSSVAAEAIYAIWRRKPHQAKFKRIELFGKFYHEVFDKMNGSQLVLAVLIYRFCDNQRRKTTLIDTFPHLPYSNYFMAMLLAELLLKDLTLNFDKFSHKEFSKAKEYFENNKETLFDRANNALIAALGKLYTNGYENIEARRLAATFRRGDLLSFLDSNY